VTTISIGMKVIATSKSTLRHSGAMLRIESGISRFPDVQLRI
jgi:hypothetical protein